MLVECRISGFRGLQSRGFCPSFRRMPYQLLYERLPALAEAETRTITLLEDNEELGLPAGEYAFCEMFCNEPGCDCRRVFFTVTSSRSTEIEAVIAYGWESADFYRKWFKSGWTPDDIKLLRGPCLNIGSPESCHSDALLKLFIRVLLPQQAYIDRVKRHYRQFRATVDVPRSPLLRRRRTGG
jgi:hypothetical protein